MASKLSPIVLTTRTLGSSTGVSQAALDLLLALSPHASELRVRAWVPTELPREVDGLPLGRVRWLAVPPLLAAGFVLSGEAPLRSVLEHARLSARELLPRLGGVPTASLEVVNGLGAHALHAALNLQSPRDRAKLSALVVHESPRHFEQPGRLTLNTALDAMRSYDYRVFVSDRGRSEWNALASLDPERSLYIPNCVHEQHVDAVLASDREALRAQYGYRSNSLRVVCVGSVSPRKGQDLVIDALYRLSSSHSPVYVDFLGPLHDAWAQRMAARVGSSPLATRVRFLGAVNDVYERIYAADVLLLASRAEASPLSVLEAMALGTSVIAADVDGVAELVQNGRSGSLFAREDVGALVACVSKLNEDPPLRAAYARAGQERYVSEFKRARQLQRWTDALTLMLR